MNLVSIQGQHAPGFQFKGDQLYACESLMKSLADDRFLVISSTYRSDILYLRERERNNSIVRIWCLYKCKEFNPSLLQRFYRSTNAQESISQFFTRLLFLSRMPKWYNQYIRVMESKLKHNPNVIAQCLHECYDLMLSKNIFSAVKDDPSRHLPGPSSKFLDSQSIVQEMLGKYQLN